MSDTSKSIDKLREIMAALRAPDTGCPWDLAQDFASIVPHTLEEAYEVAEAIESGDMDEVRDELGDLLFQVIFYARLAEERNLFDFEQVAAGIVDKLVRRHPHVFEHQNTDQPERREGVKRGLGGEQGTRTAGEDRKQRSAGGCCHGSASDDASGKAAKACGAGGF